MANKPNIALRHFIGLRIALHLNNSSVAKLLNITENELESMLDDTHSLIKINEKLTHFDDTIHQYIQCHLTAEANPTRFGHVYFPMLDTQLEYEKSTVMLEGLPLVELYRSFVSRLVYVDSIQTNHLDIKLGSFETHHTPVGAFQSPNPGWLKYLKGCLLLSDEAFCDKLNVTPPQAKDWFNGSRAIPWGAIKILEEEYELHKEEAKRIKLKNSVDARHHCASYLRSLHEELNFYYEACNCKQCICKPRH